jgi:tRNA/rRNA methyltransferase
MTSSLQIILTRPQMGENIGAAARAMANFGLRAMTLVAPRDGWPNIKASDTAGKALYILDDAAHNARVAEAVAQAQYVYATTARERALHLPVMDARDAMRDAAARAAAGQKVAVLFGPERTGLENEELMLADAVLTIPVSPEYPSLNLAQAVAVVCYEWAMAQGALASAAPYIEPAPKAELEGMFGQLEAALDAANFWQVPKKKERMWRNIRAGLLRAGLSSTEVATWRGIVRALRG